MRYRPTRRATIILSIVAVLGLAAGAFALGGLDLPWSATADSTLTQTAFRDGQQNGQPDRQPRATPHPAGAVDVNTGVELWIVPFDRAQQRYSLTVSPAQAERCPQRLAVVPDCL